MHKLLVTLCFLIALSLIASGQDGAEESGFWHNLRQKVVSLPQYPPVRCEKDDDRVAFVRRQEDAEKIIAVVDDALLVKAECLEQLGSIDAAITNFSKIIELYPNGTSVWSPPLFIPPTGGEDPARPSDERNLFSDYLAKHPDFVSDLALLGIARCQEKKGNIAETERMLLMVLEGRTAKEWKQQDKKYAESFVKFLCFRPATIAGLRLFALYRQGKKWKEALRLVEQYGVPCDLEELGELRDRANDR